MAPGFLPLQVFFAAASYAALEAVIMESYLKGIGNFSRPMIGGMLYPYHVFVMLPTIIMVSYLLAHLHCRDKPLKSVLFRTFQIMPLLIALEDSLYFIIQRNVILGTDWTCQLAGCIRLFGANVPVWYFVSIAIAFAALAAAKFSQEKE
jgi:hypothetical protein